MIIPCSSREGTPEDKPEFEGNQCRRPSLHTSPDLPDSSGSQVSKFGQWAGSQCQLHLLRTTLLTCTTSTSRSVYKHQSSRWSVQTNNLKNRRLRYWHIDISHVLTYHFLGKRLSGSHATPKNGQGEFIQNVRVWISWPSHLHLRLIWSVDQITLKVIVPTPSRIFLRRFQNSACKSCFIQGAVD